MQISKHLSSAIYLKQKKKESKNKGTGVALQVVMHLFSPLFSVLYIFILLSFYCFRGGGREGWGKGRSWEKIVMNLKSTF